MWKAIKSSFHAVNYGHATGEDWVVVAITSVVVVWFGWMFIMALPLIIMAALLMWLTDAFWPR